MGYRDIRAISFDAAGTLIFPHPGVGEIYCEILLEHRIDADPAAVESRFLESFRRKPQQVHVSEATEKHVWREIVRASLPPLDIDTFESVFEELYQSFENPERWRTGEATFEVLGALRDRGFVLVVLSNADVRFRKVFAGLRLLPYFEEIFLSTEIGFEKPHLRAFQTVESFLGLTESRILHVGDNIYQDGIGAREAGWSALLLGRHPSFPNVSSLRELPELLTAR